MLVAELVCSMLPPEMVSPAEERSPPPATEMPELVNVEVAVPWTINEDVAIKPCTVVVPEMRALPWTARELPAEIVEVPIPRKPEELKYERVVEAKFVILKGSAAWPSFSFNVRRVDWVDVPPMVTIPLTSGVEVPMPKCELVASSERKSAEFKAVAPE